MESKPRTPHIVASTGETYCCAIAESRVREASIKNASVAGPSDVQQLTNNATAIDDVADFNYFKSAQWTPDGTSILTSSADNTIRTFIVPPTLLDDPSTITNLTAYTSHASATTINCLTPYPLFNLQDPTTTVYLSTPHSLPIRLTNVLSPTAANPTSTYNLICPTTEAYLTPSSLLWSPSAPGTFLAGTDCLIALFDVSRNGQGPVTRLPTIPSKRHKMKGGGVGMRGIVSALSLQPCGGAGEGDGMLAAGTWTRWIGLYDLGGVGGTVSTFSVASAADEHAGIGGTGITQTAWSKCGKYLFVAERRSRGVLVYDVRVTGKLVAWLAGREADTNQRIGIDVFGAEDGSEIWGGGVDGVVRVWEGVGMTEGKVERASEWRAHDDPIGATMIHNSGTVVATCSGQRSEPEIGALDDLDTDSDSDESDRSVDNHSSSSSSSITSSEPISRTPDNSLKIWSL